MRMRRVVAENTEALRENKWAFREHTEAFRENTEAFRHAAERSDELRAEATRELRRTQEALQQSRLVTRDMVADMEDHRLRMERDYEASRGAFVDLAAEIRAWRADGGGAE